MADVARRSLGILGIDEATRSIYVLASSRKPVRGFEPVGPDQEPQARLEILDSWDLRRYTKNNIVLYEHEPKCAIGWGHDLEATPEGLKMRIEFATAQVEPKAEEIWRKVKAKLLRGVSVGFEFGERRDLEIAGQQVAVFSNNVLSEVSIVGVPADEDALIDDISAEVIEQELTAQDDERAMRPFAGYEDWDACISDQTGKGHSEESAKRICGRLKADHEKGLRELSDAGRKLAAARRKRSDATEADVVQRFDYIGRLGAVTRTQVGGIKVPARLTRTGVLNYRQPDGSVRRELRLPDEVFRKDSLATLEDATVTTLEHHRDFVNSAKWKRATLGHARNIRIDADTYVVGDLVINDAAAVVEVENKRLVDISCGYSCRLDMESGVWNGEPYDLIQRDITYNHVAVLPPGKGRAGEDVGIRLDAKDAIYFENQTDERTEPMAAKIIRLDGKDFEYGSEIHIGYLDTKLVDLQKRFDTTLEAHKTELDQFTAKFDAAEKAHKKSLDDLKAEEEKKETERKKAQRKRINLIMRAMAYDDEEDDDKKKEKRSDAIDELCELSDRQLMCRVIKCDDKDFDEEKLTKELRADGHSDVYIDAYLDSMYKSAIKRLDAREPGERRPGDDGVDDVVNKLTRMKRSDGKDEEQKAREKHHKESREAWTKPIPGAMSKQ